MADFRSCLFFCWSFLLIVCSRESLKTKCLNLPEGFSEGVFFLNGYVTQVSKPSHVWDNLLSIVKRGKSGTWAMFKCESLWLSFGYYIQYVIQGDSSVYLGFKMTVCTGKWDFFLPFFFFENLLLMHHINKLIHRDLTRDLSKACCIGLPSTIVRLFIHEINASHIELLSIGLCVFSKQRVCLLFHTCAYRDQTFNSTMTLYLF